MLVLHMCVCVFARTCVDGLWLVDRRGEVYSMGWMAVEHKPKDHCWFYLSYRQAIPSSSSHALLSLCCLMVTVMTRTYRSDR